MNSDQIVRETLLSSKPQRSSSYAGLASVSATFLASIIFWENWRGLAQWLPASGELVFQQKQYWRLFTAILVHSDFMHFLSNAIPLALFSSLLYGYFGPSIFPGLMILLGCIIHLNNFADVSFRSDSGWSFRCCVLHGWILVDVVCAD